MHKRGLKSAARVIGLRWMPMLALMLAAAPVTQAVQPFKWVDAEGNTHFADRPPEHPPASGVQGPHRPTVKEVMEQDRRLARQRRIAELRAREIEAERQAAEAARARALAPKPKIESSYSCADARGFAAYYARTDQEFYQAGKQGGFTRMSEAQRLATMQEWQRAVKLLCAPGAEVVKPAAAAKAAEVK